jgi:hypothetical protein
MASKQYRLKENSAQYHFFYSRKPIQIFAGGFANGKTTAAVIKAYTLAKDYPGSNGLIARSTYPKLNDTIRKEYLQWVPPESIKRRPTQEDNTLIHTNGTTVQFRYAAQRGRSRDDGSTSSNLLSATYDWIVVDQIEDPEFEYKDFLDLLGRLRGQTVYMPPAGDDEDISMPDTGPRWLMLTANPARNWFYREIIQPFLMYRDRGSHTEKLIVDKDSGLVLIDLIEGDTYSNRDNLPEDYIRNLESTYTGQMRDRYLLGKWEAYEGLVHPAYDPIKHLVSPRQMLDHLASCVKRDVRVKVLEGYDFGISVPSCYLLSFIDDSGRMFVIDGFYRKEFDYTEQPGAIQEIRNRYADLLTIKHPVVADPAIFRRQVVAKQDTGDTLARLFHSMGVTMRPGSSDVAAGIAKVNTYLTGLPHVQNPFTAELNAPLLYFSEQLLFIQDEISAYYWRRNPQGEYIDEPQDRNDHAMTTIKYMLSKLPEASKVVIPANKLPPAWKFWHEVEDRPHR